MAQATPMVNVLVIIPLGADVVDVCALTISIKVLRDFQWVFALSGV